MDGVTGEPLRLAYKIFGCYELFCFQGIKDPPAYTWVRNQNPVDETLRMMMKENIFVIIVNFWV